MASGAVRIEYASQRKIRTRNKSLYRIAHWPIWIWVFFISPGPSTFELFAHGFNQRRAVWLALVVLGTGIAALFGKLPGAEPAPYIIRFTEDKPNPLYRRVCYTFAWNAAINYALLNLVGSTCLVVWGTALVSQLILRRRADRDGTPLPLRMRGFPVLTIAGLVLLAAIFVVGFLGTESRLQLLSTFSLVAGIAFACAIARRIQGTRTNA